MVFKTNSIFSSKVFYKLLLVYNEIWTSYSTIQDTFLLTEKILFCLYAYVYSIHRFIITSHKPEITSLNFVFLVEWFSINIVI